MAVKPCMEWISILEIYKNTLQQFSEVAVIIWMMIKYNKLVIIIEPKSIYFDSSYKIDNNLEDEIYFFMKHNEFFSWACNKKTRYGPNMSKETIFLNMKNSKMNEP